MRVVDTENVTKQEIASLLASAGIESTIDEDENSVYAKAGGIDFGVFIKIDSDRARIRLFTYMQCKDGTSSEDLLRFASKLNDEYILVRFTKMVYEDGSAYLNGDYDILYPFGLGVEHFITTLKKFASIYIQAIRDEDKDDVFFG